MQQKGLRVKLLALIFLKENYYKEYLYGKFL